jgi:flagellar export protein FliJ
MQARQCWTVLADKAQDECERIQKDITALHQRQHSLQASEQRLRQLYAEYRDRINQPAELLGMQDAINQRHFMQQLSTLLDKVMQDQARTRQALVNARERWLQAEKEKLKMQALVEQDLRQQKAELHKREQKQFDELALRQFNLSEVARGARA